MTKASWLQWIGKPYDNTVEFLKEGRRDGVRLEITLKDLERLSWDDSIFGIMGQSPRKTGSVFCQIPVKRLSGITQDAWVLLQDELKSVISASGGRFIENLTGEFLVGGESLVFGTLQQIGALLRRMEKDGINIGNLRIGCASTDLVTLSPPWGILREVKKESGLRPFNADQFLEDVSRIRPGKDFDKKLHGGYLAEEKLTGSKSGAVEWINNYQELDLNTTARQCEFDFAV